MSKATIKDFALQLKDRGLNSFEISRQIKTSYDEVVPAATIRGWFKREQTPLNTNATLSTTQCTELCSDETQETQQPNISITVVNNTNQHAQQEQHNATLSVVNGQQQQQVLPQHKATGANTENNIEPCMEKHSKEHRKALTATQVALIVLLAVVSFSNSGLVIVSLIRAIGNGASGIGFGLSVACAPMVSCLYRYQHPHGQNGFDSLKLLLITAGVFEMITISQHTYISIEKETVQAIEALSLGAIGKTGYSLLIAGVLPAISTLMGLVLIDTFNTGEVAGATPKHKDTTP